MKYNLINTDNYLLVVDDSEIKEDDWFIREGSIHKCFKVHKTDIEFLTSINSVYCGSNTFWSKEYCKKIISHAPLNNSPILEGVPLLPPLEDDVEQLAKQELPISEFGESIENKREWNGFKKGYNKSREKYKFTEEDVRYLIMHSFLIGVDRGHYSKEIEDRIIQSLQQSNYPIAFVLSDKYPTFAENVKHGKYIYE